MTLAMVWAKYVGTDPPEWMDIRVSRNNAEILHLKEELAKRDTIIENLKQKAL